MSASRTPRPLPFLWYAYFTIFVFAVYIFDIIKEGAWLAHNSMQIASGAFSRRGTCRSNLSSQHEGCLCGLCLPQTNLKKRLETWPDWSASPCTDNGYSEMNLHTVQLRRKPFNQQQDLWVSLLFWWWTPPEAGISSLIDACAFLMPYSVCTALTHMWVSEYSRRQSYHHSYWQGLKLGLWLARAGAVTLNSTRLTSTD